MICELELQRKSPRTIQAHIAAVAHLAAHFGRSPDKITVREIRDYIHDLIAEDIKSGYNLARMCYEIVLAIVPRSEANQWLERYGESNEESGSD